LQKTSQLIFGSTVAEMKPSWRERIDSGERYRRRPPTFRFFDWNVTGNPFGALPAGIATACRSGKITQDGWKSPGETVGIGFYLIKAAGAKKVMERKMDAEKRGNPGFSSGKGVVPTAGNGRIGEWRERKDGAARRERPGRIGRVGRIMGGRGTAPRTKTGGKLAVVAFFQRLGF
jgi:hypothetical protein